METLTGIYMGIVINTIPDPEKRLRVQVYIPHLSTRVFENWDQDLNDRYIRNPLEMPIETQIKLSQSLPWAECAAPLWGGGTPVNLNPVTQRITINGGISLRKPGELDEEIENENEWNVAVLKRRKRIHSTAISPIDTSIAIMDNSYNNASHIDGKPYRISHSSHINGDGMEKRYPYYPYKDPDWNDGEERALPLQEQSMRGDKILAEAVFDEIQISYENDEKTLLVQQQDYIGWAAKPTDIGTTGSPNGMFSVPAYGSKVWVYFIHGDYQRPVYFANVIEQTTGISV